MRKPCLDCGVVVAQGSRCEPCQTGFLQGQSQRRGSTANRGYGSAWQRISQSILERDGYRCYLCGGWADTADHLISKRDGGTDDPENLAAACRSCNSSKGSRSISSIV